MEKIHQKLLVILTTSILISNTNYAFAGIWPFSKNFEKIDMNVYFYLPNGTERYLGVVTGVTACQISARDYAQRNDLKNEKWDYLCCTIRKGASCYEKLR